MLNREPIVVKDPLRAPKRPRRRVSVLNREPIVVKAAGEAYALVENMSRFSAQS